MVNIGKRTQNRGTSVRYGWVGMNVGLAAACLCLAVFVVTQQYDRSNSNLALELPLETTPSATSKAGATTVKGVAEPAPRILQNQNIGKCQSERKQQFNIDLSDLHSINPYENFAPETYGIKGADLIGWKLNKEAFDKILAVVKPKFMIEVGSWKGLSAVYFAKRMRAIHGQDACLQLICVDTWLGTTVAWENKDMENPKDGNTLYLRNGFPSVYYQFLYNIINSKVDDVVVPLPLPGVMGAILLKRRNAKPDTVFIDGCHDKECVLQDLESWFPIVQEGGILFGDDYERDSVKEAVKAFCAANQQCQIDLEISTKRTFVLRKVSAT